MSEPEVEPVRVRDLIVRPLGSTVLILHSAGNDETERRVFATVQVAPGDGLVLASADAVRGNGFRTALRHACRMALTAAGRSRPSDSDSPRLWLAVSRSGRSDGRGRSTAQKLAREFSADVFAPDGPVTFVVGGSIFTGTDHHGWVRFPSGGPGELHSARYPQPPWEPLLPRGVVHDGGLHTKPVPAGLAAAASEEAAAEEISHAVAVSAEHPRVVLGSPGGPPIAAHQVAALLRRFPGSVRERMQLVPASPETASPQWLGRLASLVGQDVVAATGLIRHGGHSEFTFVPDESGNPVWRPLPALLRYSPDGQVTPVLAGPAPQGWLPAGPTRFRWGAMTEPQPTPHEIVAKAVPAGLALLPAPRAAITGSADRLAHEPDRLTVTVGWPCTPLPEGMPVALHRLLSGLDAEQLERVRVLVLGIAAEAVREQLRTAAGQLAGRVHFPAVLPAGAGAETSAAAEFGPGPAETEPSAQNAPAAAEPTQGPAPEAATTGEVRDPEADAADALSAPEAAGTQAATAPEAASTPEQTGEASQEPDENTPGSAVSRFTSDGSASGNASEPGDPPAAMHADATTRIPIVGLSPVTTELSAPVTARPEPEQHVQRQSGGAGPVSASGLPKRQPGASALSRRSAQRRAELAAAKQAEGQAPRLAAATATSADAPTQSTSDEPGIAPAERTLRLSAAAFRKRSRRAIPEQRAALVPAPALPPFLAERPSTELQRATFARRAGSDFETSLTAVRAALTASPGLRARQPEEAEADLVAVHLYLGPGEFGAVAVNRVLRRPERDESGEQAACLMSGLRRFPARSGPVHRLLSLDEVDAYEPGMVLSEAGFLSASTEQVTADGFAQVLIWSRGARGLSAFQSPDAPEEAVFPAGGRFVVLDVDRGADGPALLLRELDSAEVLGSTGDTGSELLPPLRRALARIRRVNARTATGDALARITEPVGLVPGDLPEPVRS
ncbi:hypothetical protein OOZ19_14825 [Saccharopolyspora sp. NFXS83]|uniref:hypothetical protein n=1 Tax=Saccharopolyspora sp. NFXS83 TaxID=2993560 RepID=UPI00224B23A7|nr:hypothetical protein [Saccharopolyspora sp. NFXS83]MCX2731517.1 hypothetical protein [Saccharopolyspora sp. NFXS83]